MENDQEFTIYFKNRVSKQIQIFSFPEFSDICCLYIKKMDLTSLFRSNQLIFITIWKNF